jgi:hypothetical protein
LQRRRRGWTRRQRESTCGIGACRARCDKNIPGERGLIRSPISGKIRQLLAVEPGLQAKTIFEHLQQAHPGRFSDGQVRTLRRRISYWRATEGPPREVFFAQEHRPGELCQSDFTHCRELDVTINGQAFPHLIYHFVLSYSNWETGNICYSETFESLSEGLQNALWQLGGVPLEHRTDRMSAAVNNLCDAKEASRR